MKNSSVFLLIVFFSTLQFCNVLPKRKFYSNYFTPGYRCSNDTEWDNKEKHKIYRKLWENLKQEYSQKNKEIGSVPNVIAGNSLVHLLQDDILKREFAEFNIAARGISGDETTTFLERFDENVLSLGPKVLVIEIGGNDLIRGRCFPMIQNNVRKIISRAKDYNPKMKIVFLAVPPTGSPDLNSVVPVYNAFLQNLVRETEGSVYADTWKDMFDYNTLSIRQEYVRENKDPLHFNEKGYEVWAKVLRPHLSK